MIKFEFSMLQVLRSSPRVFLIFLSLSIVFTQELGAEILSLKNKIILVTGGSRGIGAEIVRQALEQDAFVILHYNSHKPSFIESISKGKILALKADFSDSEAPTKLWDEAVKWKGHIDVLINNAGVLEFTNPQDELEKWQKIWNRTLQINLVAAADLSRSAITHFKQKKNPGIIINISSRAAFCGYGPDGMAYAASKAGLVALTRSIARAYAADKISVYTIAPGFTETDMITTFKDKYGQGVLAQVREDMPTKDFATPEEVARAVVFLSSGKMPHSTGMTFDIVGAADFH